MEEFRMSKLETLIEQIKKQIGETVQTVWGPAVVVELFKGEDNVWRVHLKEFGEESFTVKVSQWNEALM